MFKEAKLRKDLQPVLEDYHKDIEKNPNDHMAWNAIGVLYLTCNDINEALKYLNRAVEIAPEEACYWNNLGVTFKYKGNLAQSLECYKKAVELVPRDIEYLFNLALIFDELEEFEKAKKSYYRILEINPEEERANNNLSIYYINKGEYQKAILILENLIRNNPKAQMAWSNLGTIYIKLEKFDKAENHYKKAIELDEEDIESIYGLGKIYFHQGDNFEALKTWRKILDLKDSHAKVKYRIAQTLMKIDEFDLAFDFLKEAIYYDTSFLKAALIDPLYKPLRRMKKFDDLMQLSDERIKLIKRPIFIDGSNVAHHQNGKTPSLENILLMRNLLQRLGWTKIFTITGSGLGHYIDDRIQYNKLINEGIIQPCPAKRDDDILLVNSATLRNGLIVSNDSFNQFSRDNLIKKYLKKNQVKFTFFDDDIQLIMSQNFYLK